MHNEIENVTINIISLKLQISFKYKESTTIKEAIKSLQNNLNLEADGRCGLYNKNLGCWLDDNKLLSSYDLTDDVNNFKKEKKKK